LLPAQQIQCLALKFTPHLRTWVLNPKRGVLHYQKKENHALKIAENNYNVTLLLVDFNGVV
jgi:hypothetical protein